MDRRPTLGIFYYDEPRQSGERVTEGLSEKKNIGESVPTPAILYTRFPSAPKLMRRPIGMKIKLAALTQFIDWSSQVIVKARLSVVANDCSVLHGDYSLVTFMIGVLKRFPCVASWPMLFDAKLLSHLLEFLVINECPRKHPTIPGILETAKRSVRRILYNVN
ncbi:hypothetical protein KIN20_018751 [Parelaphostrongylus tenuis]|uniref:Uncharacterized protein n=1 Tax=Parelaphostrongylus tenuis TaxID=148309 RepID=A0AAD5QPU1_PARTN|nr:hypothetical protein KIN20_018751 [Parelaphostrongylus tenuis]